MLGFLSALLSYSSHTFPFLYPLQYSSQEPAWSLKASKHTPLSHPSLSCFDCWCFFWAQNPLDRCVLFLHILFKFSSSTASVSLNLLAGSKVTSVTFHRCLLSAIWRGEPTLVLLMLYYHFSCYSCYLLEAEPEPLICKPLGLSCCCLERTKLPLNSDLWTTCSLSSNCVEASFLLCWWSIPFLIMKAKSLVLLVLSVPHKLFSQTTIHPV